jgi:Molecular chaperone
MASTLSTLHRYSWGRGKYHQRLLQPNALVAKINPCLPLEKDECDIEARRHFHTTHKREVLPFIALGVGIIGMYSFRALKRMDREWDDYEEELREFNLNNVHQTESQKESKDTEKRHNGRTMDQSKKAFPGGIMAIDLGTLNIRIAHMPVSSSAKPSLVVNREGKRATPNFIMFESDGSFLTGHLASAKLYERSKTSNPVTNAGTLLTHSLNDGTNDAIHPSIRNHMVEKVISSCAKDALEQVLGRKKLNSAVLFSIDGAAEGYHVQPVFCYAPKRGHSQEMDPCSEYRDAVENLSIPNSIALFRPEPICAIQGAESLSLLPSGKGTIMVVDVGASSTSISIVDAAENIKYHSRLEGFGGESLVESLMNYLAKPFYGCNHDDVSDKMAVQRLYDASRVAVMEISSGSKKNLGRVQINIPYLSVDEKMRPKHLNVGVSEKVLEAEFNEMVAKSIVPEFAMKQDVLSRSMDTPRDLRSLFASMVIKSMESSNQNPFALSSILVIGGAVRSPIIQTAIKTAIATVAGEQFVQEKVIIPKDELIEELTVLGALVR